MSQAEAPRPGQRFYRNMTVANIREQPGADHVEVLFLESARIYNLPRNNQAYGDALRLLREALARRSALTIGLASIDSAEIDEVRPTASGTAP